MLLNKIFIKYGQERLLLGTPERWSAASVVAFCLEFLGLGVWFGGREGGLGCFGFFCVWVGFFPKSLSPPDLPTHV